MPIVDRVFAQLQPESEDTESVPQPLSQYYSHPAVVVLGDPGSGKSTSFEQSAATEPNAVFIPIHDFLTFQANRWERKTLYLDGLDEQRAKTEDGRGALDRIRGKLDELKRPPYRLSCRAADWYGGSESERLRAVSPDGKILVLRLEPLSDADIITIAGDKLPDPADFLVQAQRRGIDPLLRNPQTLELIIAEVRDGVWPATRLDLFQKACERLLQETNPEHEQGQYVPLERLLTAAGYLCVVHLCGGTKGHALNPHDADEAFPYIGELHGDQEALSSAVRRRVFRGDGSGRVTPIHRTVAEYLSAHFFAQRLQAGYPLKRMLSLLTGNDGGTLAELRGIYAWLACLYEAEAATLIRRDPLGLVLYGDASKLSTSGKGMVINCLRDLAIQNPGFRAENWSAEPFGAFASPDMVPIFKKILIDEAETPQVLGCILDAIEHGPPLPDLGDDLIRIVRANARMEGARVSALDAYRHICPNDMGTLRTLLDDIHQGRVHDEHHQLRGKLFYALYPVTIGPQGIGRYLVAEVEHHINAYTMFVAHDLVRLTNPQNLPLLLSGIDATIMAGSPHHLIWQDFLGRVILQILRHHGETASSAQLYDWLEKVLDEYGHPVADRDEAEAIRNWLKSCPSVVQGLFRHWLSITPFEKPQREVHDFWQHLHNIAPPEGFHRWLLQLAELEVDVGRAEFLFREAVQGRTYLLRDDSPTLEELFDFGDRNPRFRDLIQTELCWDIPSWRREDAQRRKARQRREDAQRAIRVHQLMRQLDSIRSGKPTDTLMSLAKVYLGLFYEVDRELPPKDRLTAWATPEITEAALKGFVAALNALDIPTPRKIGELEAEGKEYLSGFLVLAGMDVLADTSMADVLSLPESTLQSGLAFHYANLTEGEREWVSSLIESLPNLAVEALAAYWYPHLARQSAHIPGLHQLAHAEIMNPVAGRVSPTLLKEFPNGIEASLELLLHAATRYAEHAELLALARQVLTGPAPLNDENRTLWYAAAIVLSPDEFKNQLADHIRGREEQAARLLTFICPSLGVTRNFQYPLSLAALVSLIAITGPIFQPQNLGGSGWLGLHSRGEAATSVRALIYRLEKDLTSEATEALVQLHDDPGLAAWRGDIAFVLANQARQRRELVFKYSTVTQVIETLNQGRPANPADLQALVSSYLHAISEELRNGPTDGWKGMWNVDGYGKPTQPRPENICRDYLLELLRPRLLPVSVAPESEGQYAEAKRADIKAIIGSINLPVEIKRHFHPDIWTAPRDQLKKLYARDPGTAGRGIYLVFWFGIDAGSVPVRTTPGPEIDTPDQLAAALLDTLQRSEREALEIIVIDCAPPHHAPARPAVRKLKKRKRS
ncbi:MAG: hypothetical protein ABI684_10235 [Nitrospirota bacterium]